MAMTHAASGELMDVRPLGSAFHDKASVTLVRAEHLEVFRLAVPAGKTLQEHTAAGAMTLQCIEGLIELEAHGKRQQMGPGSLIYLADSVPHAVTALENATLLITVLLHRV
ncbi:MAG: cupin domain-containing protein [Sterolibacterium sp.]|nr:cupin domain-containing protein [Sterolibacterium sp.]